MKNKVSIMPPDTNKERRRAPRVIKQIPLKIRHMEREIVADTINISSLGAYCTIDKYIPPFSILSIVLLLPLRSKRKKHVYNIHCEGVVVRTEENPVESKDWNVAIYFRKIKHTDRAKLAEYVQQHLK